MKKVDRREGVPICSSWGFEWQSNIDFWLYVPSPSSKSRTIFNLLSLCGYAGKTVLTELVCACASRYEVMASRLRQSRAKVTESDVESSSTHFQAP